MFEFLGALIVKALEKIVGETIDLGKQSILDRRKLFRKFFDLYEAVAELSIVDLYEGSLLVTLNDVASLKGMNLCYLQLLLPELIEYELFVPTRRPTMQARLSMSKRDYEARKYLQSEQARDQFGLVRIDLRN